MVSVVECWILATSRQHLVKVFSSLNFGSSTCAVVDLRGPINSDAFLNVLIEVSVVSESLTFLIAFLRCVVICFCYLSERVVGVASEHCVAFDPALEIGWHPFPPRAKSHL